MGGQVTRTAVIYSRQLDQGSAQAAEAPGAALGWGLTSAASFVEVGNEARDGLQQACAAIAAGEAETLFVARLQDVATSLGELLRLVDWLDGHEAALVAGDVGFDSGARSGRRSLVLLREIDRWGREGDDRRRPRGRPGLRSGSPELAQRITSLRESGLSLRAIAEALNAEGVPTPRGGAAWRASSVQATLGYERPRPPAPGTPPPPPGHPRQRKGPGAEKPRPGPRHARPPGAPRDERPPKGLPGPKGRNPGKGPPHQHSGPAR
jgi:DNA invertase Pin-like site-specific DNA recombinase